MIKWLSIACLRAHSNHHDGHIHLFDLGGHFLKLKGDSYVESDWNHVELKSGSREFSFPVDCDPDIESHGETWGNARPSLLHLYE